MSRIPFEMRPGRFSRRRASRPTVSSRKRTCCRPTMPGLEPRQALAVAAYLVTYDSRYDYLFDDDAISQSSLGGEADDADADADIAPM